MARRTLEEALATREQLLDAAERVFCEHGVGHTSLSEVADAAGVTRGAIYHHFRDKSDLFQAMVDRVHLPIDAAMDAMEQTAAPEPLARVRDMGLNALNALAGDRRTRVVYEVMFLRCEYTDELRAVERRERQARSRCLRRCSDLFAQAVDLGQLPADTDTQVAAIGIYALVGGLMRDWVQAPRSYDLRVLAPPVIDAWLAGLAHKPPRRQAAAGSAPGAKPRRLVARPAGKARSSATRPTSATRPSVTD
jgi:TetR/AcrR family transcriptional regulator, acrAB operon repressor